MMNFKDLLPEDVVSLAELYDNPGYKVLRVIIEEEIRQLGQRALSSDDPLYIRQLRGEKDAFNTIHDILKTARKNKE